MVQRCEIIIPDVTEMSQDTHQDKNVALGVFASCSKGKRELSVLMVHWFAILLICLAVRLTLPSPHSCSVNPDGN